MKRLKIFIALMLIALYCNNEQRENYKPIELKIIVEK